MHILLFLFDLQGVGDVSSETYEGDAREEV